MHVGNAARAEQNLAGAAQPSQEHACQADPEL